MTRRVLVTGAAKRLGRRFALHLAARGFDVAVHARTSRAEAEAVAEEIRAMGRRACTVFADLRDEAAIGSAVETAVAALGGLDTLVLSASSFPPDAIETLDGATFLDTLHVNTVGPFLFARAAQAHLVRSKPGRIVVLGDVHAARPLGGFLAYSAAKAALASVTQSLARAFAPDVTVNAILPGSVLPPDDFDANALERLRARTPTGRLGSPEDLLPVLDFLVDAPTQVTGVSIPVDGGRSIAP